MSAVAVDPARVAELVAQLRRFAEIDNLEMFASAVLESLGIDPDDDDPEYHVLSRSRGDDMLSWAVKRRTPKDAPPQFDLRVQIQDVGGGFARIGAIGDGNCMVHSLFTAASPTYRRQDMPTRQKIADKFRDILSIRIAELKEIANVVYEDIGGAEGLVDSFANLEGREENSTASKTSSSRKSSSRSSSSSISSEPHIRTEIDIELGPVIAQLYKFNFLAVRLDARLNMLPVKQTLYGRIPGLPTIFIHYSGGATDFGAGNAFGGQGHYEVFVRPVLEGVAGGAGRATSSRRTTARKSDSILPASGVVHLDEDETIFMFSEEELASVLTKFGDLNVANMDPKVAAQIIASVARKRAEGINVSPGSLRTLSAIERNPKLKAAAAAKAEEVAAEAVIEAAKEAAKARGSPFKPELFTSAGAARAASNNGGVSPRTLALIAALEMKEASPPRRAATRKASASATGGAGAPAPTRRSERVRKTTQKKKKSSSSNNLSPNTIAAMIESMKLTANYNA